MGRLRGLRIDWLFAAVGLVTALLVLIRPQLIVGAVVGLLGAGAMRFAVSRSTSTNASAALALLVLSLAAAGSVLLWSSCGGGGEAASQGANLYLKRVPLNGLGSRAIRLQFATEFVELPTTVRISAKYESGAKLSRAVELEILSQDLEDEADSELLGVCGEMLGADVLADAVVRRLNRLGWTATKSSHQVSATNTREIPIEVHDVLPAAATNDVPAHPPSIDAQIHLVDEESPELQHVLRSRLFPGLGPDSPLIDESPRSDLDPEVVRYLRKRRLKDGDEVCGDIEIKLLSTTRSALVIDAPARAIGKADPPVEKTQPLPGGDEQTTISLSEDTSVAKVELRSPPFRSEPLAGVADMTAWGPFQWVLGLCLAGASASFREFIGERFGRRRKPRRVGTGERPDEPT